MLGLSYPKWLNFILFQSIWFVGILGQTSFAWLLVLLLAVHLLLTDDLKSELWIMSIATAIGVTVDIVLTLTGVFIFEPTPSLLPIPFWLVAIWLGFAATFRHSMRYLMDKPAIAIPAAALAAPLSYIAGMRLGAVGFGLGELTTALVIGLLWAGLMTVFVRLYRTERAGLGASKSEASSRNLLRSCV